ncbi:hypothetical protein OF001_U150105 [Pseudomonas sp. OF001]|nr:hypothetical protein OF001_U150105 [Pseudomonas sp. OF001]
METKPEELNYGNASMRYLRQGWDRQVHDHPEPGRRPGRNGQ